MDKTKYSSVQCQSRGGDRRTSLQKEREEEQEGAIVVNWLNLLWDLKTGVSASELHSSTE